MSKSVLNKNGILLTILWSVSLLYVFVSLAFGWFDTYNRFVSDVCWWLTQLSFIGVPLLFAVMKRSMTRISGTVCAWALAALHILYVVGWLFSRFLGIEIFAFMGIFQVLITSLIHSILLVWVIVTLNTTISVKVTTVITVIFTLLSALLSVLLQYIWIHGTGYGSTVYRALQIMMGVDIYLYALAVIVALIFAIISINKRQTLSIITNRPLSPNSKS